MKTNEKIIEEISFEDLYSLHNLDEEYNSDEGIVIFGAGEPLQEWIDGISKIWKEEQILSGDSNPFASVYKSTVDGQTRLILIFNKYAKLNMGKMAIWRLRFGDTSWLSDYFSNYRKD